MRTLERSILAGLAVLLAGCSPSSMMERLPTTVGGLPAGAPPAPATPYQFPAVHDMPPPRTDTPLTAEQQDELEKALLAARDRLDSVKEADQPDDQKDVGESQKAGQEAQKAGECWRREKPVIKASPGIARVLERAAAPT